MLRLVVLSGLLASPPINSEERQLPAADRELAALAPAPSTDAPDAELEAPPEAPADVQPTSEVRTTQPASAPTAQPAPEGPAAPVQPALASAADRNPNTNLVRERPRHSGFALFLSAGVLGVTGIATNAARMAVLPGRCSNVEVEPDQTAFAAATACINDQTFIYGGLGTIAFVSNVLAGGGSGLGGWYRGRQDAHDHHFKGKYADRKPQMFIATGAVMGTVGVIGAILGPSLWWAQSAGEEIVSCETTQCATNFNRNMILVHQLSMSLAGVSAGLVTYGLSFDEHDRQYVRLAPTLSMTPHGGAVVGLSGQF